MSFFLYCLPKKMGILALLCAFCAFSVPVHAAFYDQPPFTEQELVRFIETLPKYRQWAKAEREFARPSLDKQGKASFVFSKNAEKKLAALQWPAERFFVVMGRSAAALAILEHKGDTSKRPAEMPEVSAGELALVQKHAQALKLAGSAVVKSTESPRLPEKPKKTLSGAQ